LVSDSCILEEVNYLKVKRITEGTAKFRYRGQDFPVKISYLNDNHIKVSYSIGVKSVTPGQFCVFYIALSCFGSGRGTVFI